MPPSRPPLLLTRPDAQSQAFAGLCRAELGADLRVVIAPLMRIRFWGAAIDLDGVDAIIATSANAIGALVGRDLTGMTAYCVGDATAAAARDAGMTAVSAGGDAGDLISCIRAQAPRAALLYLRGAEVRTDISAVLSAAGILVQSQVVYEQLACPLSPEALTLLTIDAPLVLPLFSPRSAVLAGEALTGSKARLQIVAMSRAVADAWSGPPPANVAIAHRPDTAAMLGTVVRIYIGACP